MHEQPPEPMEEYFPLSQVLAFTMNEFQRSWHGLEDLIAFLYGEDWDEHDDVLVWKVCRLALLDQHPDLEFEDVSELYFIDKEDWLYSVMEEWGAEAPVEPLTPSERQRLQALVKRTP